jgi:hypothetical protein
VPRLCELYPGICLPLRKKHGKSSVSVAARTSQADTVQYKKNEQYNTQKKNSNTEQYGVTEQYRTLNAVGPSGTAKPGFVTFHRNSENNDNFTPKKRTQLSPTSADRKL